MWQTHADYLCQWNGYESIRLGLFQAVDEIFSTHARINQDDDRVPVTGGDVFARWPAGISRSRTLDEVLLEHGSPYGPVLAIGDPRDPVPPLGAGARPGQARARQPSTACRRSATAPPAGSPTRSSTA